MNFNAFQRELQRRGIDPHNAFMLTLVYEQVAEMSKRLDDCASVLVEMAKTMDKLTVLNDVTMTRIKNLNRRVFGVDVHSVANDPDDDK